MATLKQRCSTKCICGNAKKLLDNYAKKRCKKRCGIEKKIASINCQEQSLLSTEYSI
jgi:hypothetical protein